MAKRPVAIMTMVLAVGYWSSVSAQERHVVRPGLLEPARLDRSRVMLLDLRKAPAASRATVPEPRPIVEKSVPTTGVSLTKASFAGALRGAGFDLAATTAFVTFTPGQLKVPGKGYMALYDTDLVTPQAVAFNASNKAEVAVYLENSGVFVVDLAFSPLTGGNWTVSAYHNGVGQESRFYYDAKERETFHVAVAVNYQDTQAPIAITCRNSLAAESYWWLYQVQVTKP
jgi:hypothetical protein